MDRASSFQNPIPLSFNNAVRGGVPAKPLPPSLLDRFRALVKEREEEIRVFGGGLTRLPLSTDKIVRLYEVVLSELTINLKPIITDLTVIAGEQRACAKGIADTICSRIIEVSVDQKLPSLYLLDSIAKNIGEEYIKYFSARLPEVFCEAYLQVHPNMHHPMRRLFGTWSSVFPSSVLQKIEAHLQFSPSVNASESPRPTHEVHMNPKYLGAQHQFGILPVVAVNAEDVSSTGRAGHTAFGFDAAKRPVHSAARITNSSPYGTEHAGPLTNSLEEFSADVSPNTVAFRASPSGSGIDLRRSRVMGREEGMSEWPSRNWESSSKQHLNTYVANKFDNDVNLQGPRALISAYGIDEREKHLHHKHQKGAHADLIGTDERVATKSWQNTEEEEFDWKDVGPALAEQRQSNTNERYPSSLPPLGKTLLRHNLAANLVASSSSHGLFNKDAGVQPNTSGFNDSTSIVPSILARDSLISQHQHSHSYLKVGLGGTHNLPTPVSGPSLMQTSGQFGINGPGDIIIDQSLNMSLYSKPHLLNTRSMSQANFPTYPNNLRGPVPLNMLGVRPPNCPLLSGEITYAMVPHMSQGYVAPERGPIGNTPNLVPSLRSSLPVISAPSISYSMPAAAWQSIPHTSFPGPSHSLPTGQNIGQVGPNPPGGALSGLLDSLIAQGLLSLSKQDSIGLEKLLKVRHEPTITSLYGDLPRQCTSCGLRFKCQEDHSKHMDWYVNKNRTLKNRKAKPSPKWFVNVSMWLSGAEASGIESVPRFLQPAEDTVEKRDDEELAVPAGEEQSTCALCGESFDDFYSDEMEEWMYKGAVYMYAPAGSTLGMDRSQLGPIVHAKCKSSDSHGNQPEGTRKDEWELPEESHPRKRLRS